MTTIGMKVRCRGPVPGGKRDPRLSGWCEFPELRIKTIKSTLYRFPDQQQVRNAEFGPEQSNGHAVHSVVVARSSLGVAASL
jgi:hypothetical protein